MSLGRSPISCVIETGIQKRCKYSPQRLPGPTWVSSGPGLKRLRDGSRYSWRRTGMVEMDTLRHIRELPEDILADFHRFLVNRKGDSPDSFMVTEDVVGYVAPGCTYVVARDAFTPTDEDAGDQAGPGAPATPPPHVCVRGTWNTHEDIALEDGNIFGGLGTLTLEQPVLDLPQAPTTAQALVYYDARLLRVGDRVVFETAINLPVTITNLGGGYVERYLKVREKGGGAYIEYHDLPHLHMPLDDSAGGTPDPGAPRG